MNVPLPGERMASEHPSALLLYVRAQAMTTALFDCLNPECWCPGGQAQLPPLDPGVRIEGAQTDWPLCEACLEPLTLATLVEPDDEMLTCLAREAFEQGDIASLRRLRAICAGMILEARQRGGEEA